MKIYFCNLLCKYFHYELAALVSYIIIPALLFVLVVYFVIQTSRATSPKKHVYFQIDEFIKQLMTSEKFDELADVIADKAAQKIRNMENQNTTAYEKGSLRHGDKNKKKDLSIQEKSDHEDKNTNDKTSKSDEVSNNSHEKTKGKETRPDKKTIYDRDKNKEKDSRSEEKSIHDQESVKKKDSRSDEKSNSGRSKIESHSQKKDKKSVKFGKIDTQAFLKNHMTSKELELNYKHLTGDLSQHRYNVKDNNPKPREEYERGQHSDENIRSVNKQPKESKKNDNVHAKNADSQEAKSDSKEFKLSDHSSNENEAHEQANFHVVDKRTNLRELKLTNSSSIEENKHRKFKYDSAHSGEKPVPRVEGQASDNSEVIEELKTLSQELNTPLYSSKEILEVRINRAHSEVVSPSNENLRAAVIIEGKNIEPNKIPQKRPRVIREENGKYFTLETSLEYAEYHENVAKQAQPKYINL